MNCDPHAKQRIDAICRLYDERIEDLNKIIADYRELMTRILAKVEGKTDVL